MDKKQLQEKIEKIIYDNFTIEMGRPTIELTKAAQEIMALFE